MRCESLEWAKRESIPWSVHRGEKYEERVSYRITHWDLISLAISTRAKTRAPRSGKCRAWKEGNYQEKRGCRGGRRRGRQGRALIGLVPVLGCAARRAEGDIVGGGKPSSHAPRQDRVQGDGHRARRRREERRRLPPPSSAVAADCSPIAIVGLPQRLGLKNGPKELMFGPQVGPINCGLYISPTHLGPSFFFADKC